ncbi:DUF3348 domain-containing protein [Paraburkholderia sp. BCC1885]|uniref:DUF3348 domain-containing protein n=1 Tax=Paraburkholderia sp. BCC1885 TaxID=2562669 RepID=UPI0011828FB4|nr:DUF3348 domain-containing protein [Paraburkholderia sp. BCC1885]
MLQAPQRTALSGPALIRALARLTDLDVPASSQSLSDRLSQWLGWTDAIGLSTALGGKPPAVPAGARVDGPAEEAECARVRASLTQAIVGDGTLGVARRRAPSVSAQARAAQDAAAEPAVDYAVFRQRYLSIQQTMETAIGNLRGRLRALLATRTPSMARLALVDAVMERALSAREHNLLATLPGMLAGHFERLRQAERDALAAAEASDDGAGGRSGAWLDLFRKDMQGVLLAELEVRFQPVEGLLAALLTR